MFFRGRRLRSSPALRDMMQETRLSCAQLIMPYFVVETSDTTFQQPISSMPGQFQFSIPRLLEHMATAVDAGLYACLLFGIPTQKDAVGSGAYAPNGVVQQAVRAIKKRWPELLVVTDVCLCEYTSHGHCGLLTPHGTVQNDPTLELLAQTAVSHAEAGADIVAPSDMMDGRIGFLRKALNEHKMHDIPIMSYAVKYASGLYGPFREAAESAPQSGDRKAYQMNPANRLEALREARADVQEGADILMVKPAGAYLDIIRDLRVSCDLPIAAYQVSGEYSMIKAAGINGWLDEQQVMLESLLAIRRAGADLILSYFTEDIILQRLFS